MPILTIADAIVLSDIIACCSGGQPITLAEDERIVSYTARAIVGDDEGCGLLSSKQDVRDGFVWMSGTFERFMPVVEMMALVKSGEAALNYRC